MKDHQTVDNHQITLETMCAVADTVLPRIGSDFCKNTGIVTGAILAIGKILACVNADRETLGEVAAVVEMGYRQTCEANGWSSVMDDEAVPAVNGDEASLAADAAAVSPSGLGADA